MKSKIANTIALALLFLTFYVRTYRIDYPIADWHSWRQADTAAVARNFIKSEFNLLYPQSDSLLALNDKGLENPKRYFMNEFPIYNAIVAVFYSRFGIDIALARYLSIFMSTLGALFLYLLARDLLGRKIALLSLAFYALNPYNIYYGRVIMPDPSFVSLSIISLYFCIKFARSNKLIDGLLMSLVFALATLVKPYAVFIFIPILYWLLRERGFSILKDARYYLLAIIAITPLLLWRYHLYIHPEGSFATRWLLNGDGIRFKGSFFRWIIYDRFNRLIFATGGFVLFVVGLFKSYQSKNSSFFFVWALSIFMYITIFAKGNVNHDYYQLPIVPVGSVLVALGSYTLIRMARNRAEKTLNALMVFALLSISLAFGWFEVRDFFNINNPAIVRAGEKIDEIAESDALVIAPYQGDPAFLYQTNRHGWPIGGDINTKIKEGADYYVTTSRDDEYARVKEYHQLIFENDEFSIIKLSPVE